HRSHIFASGEIGPHDGERLAEFVRAKDVIFGSEIYLHSPGGSLAGGINLGKAIREAGLNTTVAQRSNGSDELATDPGECYSACALAYIGGRFRWWMDGSRIGVHRFYWDSQSPSDVDLAQIISATVVEYIKSMNVDTGLFEISSQAGRDEIIELT